MTDITTTDPLLGFSPDEIVVDANGQTLAQADAADEQPVARRRDYPIAIAIVLPPPDGRPILREPRLVRYAHGLWPQGYSGEVVGVLIDTGAGLTEADIRAALTVTVIDPVFHDAIGGAVADYVWCEIDTINAEDEAAAGDRDRERYRAADADRVAAGLPPIHGEYAPQLGGRS